MKWKEFCGTLRVWVDSPWYLNDIYVVFEWGKITGFGLRLIRSCDYVCINVSYEGMWINLCGPGSRLGHFGKKSYQACQIIQFLISASFCNKQFKISFLSSIKLSVQNENIQQKTAFHPISSHFQLKVYPKSISDWPECFFAATIFSIYPTDLWNRTWS